MKDERDVLAVVSPPIAPSSRSLNSLFHDEDPVESEVSSAFDGNGGIFQKQQALEEEEEEEEGTDANGSTNENANGSTNENGNGILDVSCSLEISNDSSLCDFAQTYGLCEEQQQFEEDLDDSVSAATSKSSPSVDRIYIPFDYELYFTSTEPPIDFVQGNLLQQLSRIFDLPDCSYQPSQRGLRKRRLQDTSRPSNRQDQETPEIVGISTGPDDRVDFTADCVAPVERDVRDVADCHRIEGQITVYANFPKETSPPATETTETNASTTSQQSSVQRYERNRLIVTSTVLKNIRDLMNQNQLLAEGPGGAIERVIFVGQRQDLDFGDLGEGGGQTAGAFSQTIVRAPNGAEAASVSTVGICFLVLLALTLLTAVVAVTHRRRQRTQQPKDEDDFSVVETPVIVGGDDQQFNFYESELKPPVTSDECQNELDADENDATPHWSERAFEPASEDSAPIEHPNSSPVNTPEMDLEDPLDRIEPRIEPEDNPFSHTPTSPTRTLDNLSEPEPMTSWVDDDDTVEHPTQDDHFRDDE